MNETKKVSAVLPMADFDILRELAAEQGITMTEALRRALKTTKWLRDETIEKGTRLILRGKDRKEREAVLVD